MIDLKDLKEVAEDKELLEVGRLAVEDVLIEYRDGRISVFRNNGLVVKERDGEASSVIRLGTEDALRIALLAMVKHLDNKVNK